VDVDYLFRRFAVEVLVIGLGLGSGVMNDAVPMIRRRVNRIELQRGASGIDDVVIRPGRDENREARPDRRPNAIEDRFAGTLLHAKELVQLVDFGPDFFLWLQGHDDELAALGRVKHPAKIGILDGETFYVLDKAFHDDSLYEIAQIALGSLPAFRQMGFLHDIDN
jgi:hypothetical protein